jgi:hypothetical protein
MAFLFRNGKVVVAHANLGAATVLDTNGDYRLSIFNEPNRYTLRLTEQEAELLHYSLTKALGKDEP